MINNVQSFFFAGDKIGTKAKAWWQDCKPG